jgi:hypothetical protein
MSAYEIPVEDVNDDPYKLDQDWLDEYKNRLTESFAANDSPLARLLDRQLLQVSRLQDTLEYAFALGPQAVLQAIIERIRRGTISR